MRIRLTPLASEHLLSAYDYLQALSPAAAKSQLSRIFNAIDRLQQFPYAGRKGRLFGTREFVIPRTSFIVAYTIVGREVQILAVLHGSRQWPQSF